MKSQDALRAEIAEVREAQARDAARTSQIDAEVAAYEVQIEALHGEQEHIAERDSELAQHLDALQRALAVLEDHAPVAEPAPEPKIQAPAPRAVEPDPEPTTGTTGTTGTGGHYAKDPMRVLPKRGGHKPGHGAGSSRTPIYDATDLGIDLNTLSPTDTARAQLVFEHIEAEDSVSQYELAIAISEWMECSLSTAASLVTRALKVLLAQDRIVYTGAKVTSSGTRRDSPVWRAK